jgi:hypothetical protein
MKKPFPESTAQPHPDVVMPAPTFPLHMPKQDDGMVSEEEIDEEFRKMQPNVVFNDPDPHTASLLRGSPLMPLNRVPDPNSRRDSPSYLYIERRPAKTYQFEGRPSPGDLKRIERKQLTVLGYEMGKFVRFLPNGTTEPVQTHEDASHA